MQFQLNCVRDVIFHSYSSELLANSIKFWSHVTYISEFDFSSLYFVEIRSNECVTLIEGYLRAAIGTNKLF